MVELAIGTARDEVIWKFRIVDPSGGALRGHFTLAHLLRDLLCTVKITECQMIFTCRGEPSFFRWMEAYVGYHLSDLHIGHWVRATLHFEDVAEFFLGGI